MYGRRSTLISFFAFVKFILWCNLAVEATVVYVCSPLPSGSEQQIDGQSSIYAHNHCFDYSDGNPTFVRGTYSLSGYFEGTVDHTTRTARLSWYEANLSSPSSGNVTVQFSSFENGYRVKTVDGGTVLQNWDALICTNSPQANSASVCFWSSPESAAALPQLLNKSKESVDLSIFRGLDGSNGFCFEETSSAGYYDYTYSTDECRLLGIDCLGETRIEDGRYQRVGDGGAIGRSIAGGFLYAGTWTAVAGPAKGMSGTALYSAVVNGSAVSLVGGYCFFDAHGKRQACFRESYHLGDDRATCMENGFEQSQGMSTSTLLVAILVPILVTFSICVLFGICCMHYYQVEEDEAARKLRNMVAELRVRFKLTPEDGFALDSDPAPPWWRSKPKGTTTFIPKCYLDAAARLGCWEDFDVDQFDTLCLILKSPNEPVQLLATNMAAGMARRVSVSLALMTPPASNTASKPSRRPRAVRTPQYEAIREWLVEVTTKLLDPTEEMDGQQQPPPPPRIGTMRMSHKESRDAATMAALLTAVTPKSSQRERFRYVEKLVCKLRVWRESDNLFNELKVVVQTYMDAVAKQCDERYALMAKEPFGAELVALQAPPVNEGPPELSAPTSPLSAPEQTPSAVQLPMSEIVMRRRASSSSPGADGPVPISGVGHGGNCDLNRFLSGMFSGAANDEEEDQIHMGMNGMSGSTPNCHAGPASNGHNGNSNGEGVWASFLFGQRATAASRILEQHMPGAVTPEAGRPSSAMTSRLSSADTAPSSSPLNMAAVSASFVARVEPTLGELEEEDEEDEEEDALDTIYRQDHVKVGAIRVDQDVDRKEARLEAAAATNSNDAEVLNEEVFVAQLHRRAELLNKGFCNKVEQVVRSHSEEFAGPPPPGSAQRSPMVRVSQRTSGNMIVLGGKKRRHQMVFRCHFDGHQTAEVIFETAPVKSVARMREKVADYAPPHPISVWPYSANILDPIRVSIICEGPSQILQVARWFAASSGEGWARPRGGDEASVPMPVCRFKNKFAYPREEVPNGYRDLKIYVIYTGLGSLRIIGEIQIHDSKLHYLKQKMHKLYQVMRASHFDALAI